MSNDKMTTADAQAMIEEVMEFERVGGPVAEAKGYDIEQKPGKDYWYVKRGGKKIGAISKGKNEKFDADTDTEGGGEYKAGFDTIAAAAEWLASKDKTAKTESELAEADEIDFYELYGDQQKLVKEMKRFGYKPTMAWRGGIGTIVEFKAPPANVGRMDAAALKRIIGAKTFRWFEARNDGEVAIGM